MRTEATRPLIAVLGSSGLLGTALTRQLAARPVRLRLVGRRPTTVPVGCPAQAEVRRADLAVDGEVAAAVAGADAIVHLVAHMSGPGNWRVADTDPMAERINVGLLRDLIAAVRTQRASTPPVVVLAGSMSQVGESKLSRIDGSETDRPLTVYDRHKLTAEHLLEAASAEGLVRGATLRLATLYSDGQDATNLDRGVVATMVRRALTDQPLTMWHGGVAKRDLLTADDAAAAFLAALDHSNAVAGRHWLIGTGVPTSIADLFTAIAKVSARLTGRPPAPVVSAPAAAHALPTDRLDFVLDPSGYQQAIGWRAGTQLADGLESLAAAVLRETR